MSLPLTPARRPQKHASVRIDGDSLVLTDLSINGTWVNGKRITKGVPTAVSVGSTICA